MGTLFAGTSGGTQEPDCLLGDPIWGVLGRSAAARCHVPPECTGHTHNFPTCRTSTIGRFVAQTDAFSLVWEKECPETFSYGNLGRKSQPAAAADGFTLTHHVLAHSASQMKIRLHVQAKTRLDLQDRLDTIDASAKTMMSTANGLDTLESTMQQLLSGPGVATADRQWLRDQLCRVCVRQSLPFNML